MPQPMNREAYLNRVVTKPVTLADGSIVNIRALPASFLINGAQSIQDEEYFGPANMLAQSLVDADGHRLFEDGERELAMAIDNTSLRVLMEAIMALNGMAPPAKPDEPGDIEKN